LWDGCTSFKHISELLNAKLMGIADNSGRYRVQCMLIMNFDLFLVV
jgi:hypothetical protein